jgi:endonuclease G
MKKKVILLISAIIVSSICIYAFSDGEGASSSNPELVSDSILAPVTDTCIFVFIENLEIPETKPEDEIISHVGYSFLYNESHEQSDWVAYLLTAERATSVVKRKDNFRPDPAVKTGTATNNDYAKTGYDKGHLAPCADMCWSRTVMDESFFFSNMTPQAPSFNRGVWKRLEDLVRTWAFEYDTLYIATGPVLRDGLPVIGKKNKVSVPEYHYKVILHYTSNDIKGIGFILPNEGSNLPLQDFAVTIDSVEIVTGINFFYQLSEAQEKCAESTFSTADWIWSKSAKEK